MSSCPIAITDPDTLSRDCSGPILYFNPDSQMRKLFRWFSLATNVVFLSCEFVDIFSWFRWLWPKLLFTSGRSFGFHGSCYCVYFGSLSKSRQLLSKLTAITVSATTTSQQLWKYIQHGYRTDRRFTFPHDIAEYSVNSLRNLAPNNLCQSNKLLIKVY